MGDLSNNFSRWEFQCKCGCGENTVDSELLQVLEGIRENFGGMVVTVKSGHRCFEYNVSIGGSFDSQHLRGRAADIAILGCPAALVQRYLKNAYPGQYGIGSYTRFTHIDTKSGPPRRWKG